MAPRRRRQTDEVCEAHLATFTRTTTTHGPYYLLGYSLGGTLAQGIAARLRPWRTGGISWLAGCRPPETQTGRKKKPMVWIRKCWRRLTASAKPSGGNTAGSTSTELFTTIEGNYADAVRLLTTAHSVAFDGKATLFVAERTLQEGMSPEQAQAPWIAELISIVRICAHGYYYLSGGV